MGNVAKKIYILIYSESICIKGLNKILNYYYYCIYILIFLPYIE